MIDVIDFPSRRFNQERRVRIFRSDVSNKPLPVLYMHDGQNVFCDEDAIGGVSLQLKQHLDEKTEVIVVAIDQIPECRADEYCPWVHGRFCERMLGERSVRGGDGKEYIEFITHELKPWVDHQYPTRRNRTAMAGISLGGLISLYAGCIYPHIYQNIMVLSSAFFRNQEELEGLIRRSDLSQLEHIYMDWGTAESEKPFINEAFLQSNERIYELLKSKGVQVEKEVVFGDKHLYSCFQSRVHHKFNSFLRAVKGDF
ncbi:Predicted hydrolase of the alpha/beta superfamily [Halobacillus dabanensis]|uniref:Predicted hydrolase of the alpha/beta superfamily n=1 Tax=Halobacillus dabanensis TaxID=240302 RepID=A0A1I3T9N7_HALDA|nr:alpha/beta hydrolase-fold protein [Halobacillus dabanensis]SFJ67794.1 Predicted hydrolase of the alpha/beta superfamily [Halobacillus dabanensis]